VNKQLGERTDGRDHFSFFLTWQLLLFPARPAISSID